MKLARARIVAVVVVAATKRSQVGQLSKARLARAGPLSLLPRLTACHATLFAFGIQLLSQAGVIRNDGIESCPTHGAFGGKFVVDGDLALIAAIVPHVGDDGSGSWLIVAHIRFLALAAMLRKRCARIGTLCF
jgi:hypothetical protein